MSVRVRYYVVFENRDIRRVPEEMLGRLARGEERLAAHAGAELRFAEIVVHCDETGAPAQLATVSGFYLKFAADGALDRETPQIGAGRILASLALPDGVELEQFKAVQADYDFGRERWVPKPNELGKLVGDALGQSGPLPLLVAEAG